MRRFVVLIMLVMGLALAGSLGSVDAQNDGTHPFSSTWCSSPVVIPLADADATSTTPAAGVATARGAQAVLSSRGPIIRMTEQGSRVQVTLGQTLFHTQWLFGGIDSGDSVRADAFLGRARQPISSSSIRGSLELAPEQSGRGLTAASRLEPRSTGEIDIFVGATEVLLTNEGPTAVDLIAVIGCPALEISTEVLSVPTWDSELQRFVAEHEVTFRNRLANPRASALRSQDANAASTVIDDLVVDLAIRSAGFRSADVVSMSLSRELDRRRSDTFDGVRDTGLLFTPLRLTNGGEQRLRFTVAYEPNFNDPTWAEGVDVPAPTISLRGRVDAVRVGVSAQLRPVGAEVDASASPSQLVTPAPGLTVEHRYLAPSTSTQNGVVQLSERITVTNVGDTAVTELVVRYPLADMYGAGTVFTEFSGLASNDCAGTFSSRFNGGRRSVMVYAENALDVGQKCTIDLRASVRPGLVPTTRGLDYESPIVATAQSGRRDVRDAIAVQSTLAQNSQVVINLAETTVTNLQDGRYRFVGSITARNIGDQDVSNLATRIDLTTAAGGSPVSTPVVFEDISGDELCTSARLPQQAATGRTLTSGANLAVGESCTVGFSVVARPGEVLDSWNVTASAEALSPRRLAIDIPPDVDGLTLPEAPAIDSSIVTRSLINNADGTYTLTLDTTITNTGDTPLTSVATSDDGPTVFGESLLGQERIGDNCWRISPRRPMPASGDASCSVTQVYVVEPGAQLTGWTLESASAATSTSSALVDSTATTPEIIFTEAPELQSSIVLASIDKLDDRNVRIELTGSLLNTGDVEVRSVQAKLDLDEALHGAAFSIERVAVDGATVSATFDGKDQVGILTGVDEIASQARADWRLVIVAATRTDSGPFTFTAETEAVSPAQRSLAIADVSVDRTVPLIQIVDRVLTSTNNNNDGTYEIEHIVSVRNVGKIDVPQIVVSTDFDAVFDGLIVGETRVDSTCAATVVPGAACTSTRRATLRPGSAVGPHEVAVDVSSADVEQLSALVVDPPATVFFDSRAKTPLRFEEAPSIVLETDVSNVINNGDGTYTTTYSATVSNTGDVPLYRVGIPDLVAEAFGNTVVTNFLEDDSCTGVSFSNPLGPGRACDRSQTVTVRPGTALGPWPSLVGVTADSPSFTTVFENERFDMVTFSESVSLDADSTLVALANNGDGTYNVVYEVVVTNASDVPLIDIVTSDAGAPYGDRRISQKVLSDGCTGVSLSTPLAPAAQCRIELNQLLRPAAELGPFDLTTTLTGTSPSGRSENVSTTTNSLTLTEAPAVALQSSVVSVESVDDKTFRVVTNLVVENVGDVVVNDLALVLDLDEVFPEASHRIDGVISNDFVIEEAFAAAESLNLVAPGQRLRVGATGTITLIVSIQPNGDVGPFVGELRASATSPALNDVSAVIAAQVDLPSISVDVVAQSVGNNRDGSYIVTTSYEVINDGSTPLEFVRLIEDVASIYDGTLVRTLSVESSELSVADLTDRRRRNDLLEWGSTLDAGTRAVVTTSVLVEPGNVLGPFVPTAITNAVSPAGTEVGAVGFAPDEVEFVEKPALRVSQILTSRPAWKASGSFDVSFAIDVVNDGDVELRNLQVREDLLNALGADSRIAVRGIRSETLAVNTEFDGLGQLPRSVEPVDADELEEQEARPASDVGDTRLLGGWNTLPAGETATIELDLTITPENRGVYSTRVVVSAFTPAGAGIGSGGDEVEANTLTRLSVQGEIGVAKQTIGEATVRPDGSVGVTYEILVENAGPFPLSNVQVHDQLSQAFGVGSTFVTSRVRIEAQSPCEGFASSSYDGGTIDPVLVSGVDLQPGESCRIQYDAVVIPSKALPGPFRSSAFAIASDPFSGTVIDDSTDGTNTDPDGNQEPGDNDIATAVRVVIPESSATLEVVALESSSVDSDERFDFGFSISLTNTGAVDIDTTRLLANLDEAWNVPYEVVSLTSDDLVVNRSFNGGSNTNLLQRRNRLRAGATAQIELRLRAAQPRSGDLELPIIFNAESVTGSPIDVELDQPVIAFTPGESLNSGILGSMTTEEKRLLALGIAAMALFVGIFVRRTVLRVRRFKKLRAVRRAEVLARDELFVDLRANADARRRVRSHPPHIDLREDDAADPVEHHSPRRRRGRRPTEKQS